MVDDLFEVFEDLFERKRKKKSRRDDDDEARPRDARPAPAAPPVFCLQCGTRNEAASRFCQECGDVLPAAGEEMRCLKCNAQVPLTAKFCGRCGSRVA